MWHKPLMNNDAMMAMLMFACGHDMQSVPC